MQTKKAGRRHPPSRPLPRTCRHELSDCGTALGGGGVGVNWAPDPGLLLRNPHSGRTEGKRAQEQMVFGKDRKCSVDSALNGSQTPHPKMVTWNSKILGQEGGGRKKRNRSERERVVLAMA